MSLFVKSEKISVLLYVGKGPEYRPLSYTERNSKSSNQTTAMPRSSAALVEEEQEDEEEADDENNNEEESHHISSTFTIHKIDEILHILATYTSPPKKRGLHFSPFDLSIGRIAVVPSASYHDSHSIGPSDSLHPNRIQRLLLVNHMDR